MRLRLLPAFCNKINRLCAFVTRTNKRQRKIEKHFTKLETPLPRLLLQENILRLTRVIRSKQIQLIFRECSVLFTKTAIIFRIRRILVKF